MPKSEPVEQYDLRADLYELYHYFNHTVLFGVSNEYTQSGHGADDLRHREVMPVVHFER